MASCHPVAVELFSLHLERNLNRGPLGLLCHKENLEYKLKNASDKKLKAPNSGKLYFLAHKLAPVFLVEENS